jgi:hypothetical protein
MSNPTISQGQIWRRARTPGIGDLHVITGLLQDPDEPVEVATIGQPHPESPEHRDVGGYMFLGTAAQFLAEFTYVSPGTVPAFKI